MALNNGCLQIENGELAGIGTGASVWPAAHVLCKYFEGRYGAEGVYSVLGCMFDCAMLTTIAV